MTRLAWGGHGRWRLIYMVGDHKFLSYLTG